MRQIIMDHYEHPRNKVTKTDPLYTKLHVGSEGCIDSIDLYAKIENDVLVDIAFEGVACAISTASTSIMSELLKGKTNLEALATIKEFEAMIQAQPYDEEILEEAVVFKNTYKQANRIKCATIGWDGIKKIILEHQKK